MKLFQVLLSFMVETSRSSYPSPQRLQVAVWSIPPTLISLSGEDATQHILGGGGDAINLRTNKS